MSSVSSKIDLSNFCKTIINYYSTTFTHKNMQNVCISHSISTALIFDWDLQLLKVYNSKDNHNSDTKLFHHVPPYWSSTANTNSVIHTYMIKIEPIVICSVALLSIDHWSSSKYLKILTVHWAKRLYFTPAKEIQFASCKWTI